MFQRALPVVAVTFCVCVCVSALAIKFPGTDGYLAHVRALTLEPSRFCVHFFQKRQLTAWQNFKLSPHRLWLKLRVLISLAARKKRNAPYPRRPGEAAPPETRQLQGVARLHRKELTGSHLHAACTQHVFRRATGTSCGVIPARLSACKRHVLRQATGTSRGVQPARLAASNRHVSGVQSAPSDAQRHV